MKLKAVLAVVVCIMIVATVYVFTLGDASNITNQNQETAENPLLALGEDASFNDAVNAFSFNLFEQLFEDPKNEGNIFYSPYSTYTALAMTYEGAKGLTAEEMKKVLYINQDSKEFHEYMQTLYEYLNQEGEYDISTANALWVRQNYQLLKEYTDLIKTVYDGGLSEVDFSNPQEAVDIINQWIENKTNNLIKDLIKSEDIDPFYTMLVLTNAIYFKGTWQVQFDEEDTIEKEFETSQGEIITTPTMCMTDKEDTFNYFENEDLQILELPYAGEDISMMIFLPKEGVNLSDIMDSMDRETYKELLDSMSKTKLDIYLPKFKIQTPVYKLKDYLIKLGMPTAFSSAADFSGMDGTTNLYISKVLHKAFIEVNEEGTAAAAATAVIMNNKSISIDLTTVFDADHPFLFTIHQKETNTILFMGNVDNPLE